ncbi:hypothetical protein ACCS93_39245, partial [Rhizobium ruizarguesonis]
MWFIPLKHMPIAALILWVSSSVAPSRTQCRWIIGTMAWMSPAVSAADELEPDILVVRIDQCDVVR